MFDYEKIMNIDNRIYVSPMRYVNTISIGRPSINGTWVDYGTGISSKESSDNCIIEMTNGEILVSGSLMNLQQSCEPHSYNAGNYYNFPAVSAKSGEPTPNSACPKGWRLPDNNGDTSYSNLLLAYGIDFNAGDNMVSPYDAALLNLPLSYLRSGYHNSTGALSSQDSVGGYRMSSLRLGFNSSSLYPTSSTFASDGFSVRCVSR